MLIPKIIPQVSNVCTGHDFFTFLNLIYEFIGHQNWANLILRCVAHQKVVWLLHRLDLPNQVCWTILVYKMNPQQKLQALEASVYTEIEDGGGE